MTIDKNDKHKAKKPRAKRIKKNKGVDGLSYNHDLLVKSWQSRDTLYQQLFGSPKYISPANYGAPIQPKTKDNTSARHTTNIDTNKDLDLSNQQLAIFTYEPDPLRPYWTYITAGLSTPWLQDEEQEVSGFGLELMIRSPTEAEWPAQLLRTMAYYIFNHMGTLSPGKRLALNSPIIAGSGSLLRNVLIWYAEDASDCWYQLPSGGFGIFTAIGITDDEMRLTESMHEEYGTWCMLQVLTRLGINQITDPSRPSIFANENISSIIDSVKDYAEQFHQAFPQANQLRGRQTAEEQN
jgi:hypothetical protein